ncbi:MAG: UDP-N-acetylmuramoyl-L-alanine--D-glutamate ligase [Pseudomonadota bacterium]|nr:UDP-N-acetylmuramoyl-L-alanine--D-glutamate ligase [Pseudomonadota bacterium]
MRISQLEAVAASGGRIALWGWGREGRAAYRALRGREIGNRDSAAESTALALTLFCNAEEAEDAAALGDPALAVESETTAERLAAFAIVIKSPGISAYRPELLAAQARGTRFVSGTALWFAETPDARTVCVTGTKGKSTTTALLAHLMRAGGVRTALAGNIGMPLLELLDGEAQAWAIELSSYQTRDLAGSGVRPEIAVVTNVFPEHLDWHGSEQRYVEDKLALLTDARPRIAVLNSADPRLAALGPQLHDCDLRWFGREDGWHLRGEVVHRGDTPVLGTGDMPLPGRHNRGNLCAALAAIEAFGLDATALAPHAAGFQPLPHRLQVLGTRAGISWVNDSISTTPHATLAALEVYRGDRVAVLVGGHDRGLDWNGFVQAMRGQAPITIVCMGQNGPRIHAILRPLAVEAGFVLHQARDLTDAVGQARAVLAGQGVLLLSPGAPSFGTYRDYTERGRHFAELGGFDPCAISAIPGLGIA